MIGSWPTGSGTALKKDKSLSGLRLTVGWGGWLLAAACAHAAGPAGGSIYTCVDESGRKLTSDRPISACLDRPQRELSPSGNTRRVIGPSLTEHERAERAAIARREQDERDHVAEERRRERVLVARYPDQAAHDVERKAALETVDSLIDMAQQRKLDLLQRRKALIQEMEFYQRDPAKAPMKLQREMAENDADTQEQQRFIDAQAQEKRRIHQRFDKELVQLRALWVARHTVPGVVSGIGAAPR